jgi:hypothetical protein
MAVASILAALAVLVAQLALGRYPSPRGPDQLIGLFADSTFRAQSAVILIQVFLMFLALWGVTAKMYRYTPGLIMTGFLIFVFWQVLEILPRAIGLFAGSYAWAPAFEAATDEAVRTSVAERFRLLMDSYGALATVGRVLWGAGHLLFGLALWRLSGWYRVIAGLFVLNSIRLGLGFLGPAIGVRWLDGGVALFVSLMVPLFTLIGIWLWRKPFAETVRV